MRRAALAALALPLLALGCGGQGQEAVAAQTHGNLQRCIDVCGSGVGTQDRVLDPRGKGGSVYFFRSL